MRAVNLLPLDARPGARWATVGRDASAPRVLSFAGGIATGLALLVTALAIYQRDIVDGRRVELQNVETRLVAAEARAADVQAARAASNARLTAFQTVVAQRLAWENVLLDLSRVLPANVFLQSLDATSPTLTAGAATTAAAPAAAPPTGSAAAPIGFTIAGSADSQVRVAQVLDRLALLPWLSDVTLQSSVRGGEGSSVQFTIGATLGSTGGPS
jgi:Tfp pilus assembly protein PilN